MQSKRDALKYFVETEKGGHSKQELEPIAAKVAFGHFLHAARDEDPSKAPYFPAPHSSQELVEFAPTRVEYLPGGQCWHAVLESTAAKEPAGQDKHSVQEVPDENLPGKHSWHSVACENA